MFLFIIKISLGLFLCACVWLWAKNLTKVFCYMDKSFDEPFPIKFCRVIGVPIFPIGIVMGMWK